jgi:hypothetical protein
VAKAKITLRQGARVVMKSWTSGFIMVLLAALLASAAE